MRPGGMYTLDKDGNPVLAEDTIQWAAWMETSTKERKLHQDHVGEIFVSTVFLSLDHNFEGGDPILWETMIFGGEHDGYQKRHSTKEEAKKGHALALDMAKNPDKYKPND